MKVGSLVETTADRLQKGDIFSFGKNFWDGEQRFHSYRFYVDNKQEWLDEYQPGSRICFHYIPFNYAGEIENDVCLAFQWQHIQNPAEIKVYLKSNHIVSESPKRKGELYYNDHNNSRVYVPYRVNAINMLNESYQNV